MIEREKFENQDPVPELFSGDHPLTERWIGELLPIFETRKGLVSQLVANEVKQDGDLTTFENGIIVPSFLVPIMSGWAKEGPVILCSYAHPEELDLYKFGGQLNLLLLLQKLRANGIEVSKVSVVENWYETVGLDQTVTTPLNFGNNFPVRPGIKADIFNLGSNRAGLARLDPERQLEALEVIDSEKLARGICDRLTSELDEELRKTSLTRRGRFETKTVIKDLVESRISLLINLAKSISRELCYREAPTVNEFLIEFEQRFAGLVVGGGNKFGLIPKLGQITGIEGVLSSKNARFTSLIIDTLEKLVDARGPDVLKKLVNSTGEGLFLKVDNGREMILTVEQESGQFIVMDKRTWEIIGVVVDSEIIQFVRSSNFRPLAKSETIALVAGGMTFHMGSEHGNRERALFALGLNDDKFELFRGHLSGLRIGQDLEQGNTLFEINGANPIPAILAFALFGTDFLREKLISKAGVESQPENLEEKELKRLAATKLVESVFSGKKSEGLSQSLQSPGIMHAGYLWG